MPTVATHAVAGFALGKTFAARRMSLAFWVLTLVLSVLPDVDVLAFRLGIPYRSVWGHRGILHSLPFAAAVGLAVVLLAFRDVPRFSKRWWGLVVYFFGILAVHDLLDAMTDGGLGIALFAPFVAERYFLPWRPLRVAPIGLSRALTPAALDALLSEMLYVWLPLGSLALAARFGRRLGRPRERPSPPAAVSP